MKFLKENTLQWAAIFLSTLLMLGIASCDKETDVEKQAAIDRTLIDEYVANHNMDGQYTLDGVYFQVLESGDGNYPYSTSVVKVTYKGFYLDDTVFEEGFFAATPLSGLILGWQDGIKRIDRGGKIKFLVPSRLAYGTQQYGDIPPNTVLGFEVTLHDFE